MKTNHVKKFNEMNESKKDQPKNDTRVLIQDYDGLLAFGYVKDNMYKYDGSIDWNQLTDIKNWISISDLKNKLGW